MGQVKFLKVRESDGAPSLPDVREFVFPNGSLTDSGGGVVTVNVGSPFVSPLIVRQSGGVAGTDEVEVTHDGNTTTLRNKDTGGIRFRNAADTLTTFQVTNTGGVNAVTFAGDGALLTGLNATELTTGTVADARLSSNVPLKNAVNTFTAELQAEERLLINPGGGAPSGSSILFEVTKDGGTKHISIDYYAGVSMGEVSLSRSSISYGGASAPALTAAAVGSFTSYPACLLFIHRTSLSYPLLAQRGSSTDAVRDVWDLASDWADATDATRAGRFAVSVYSTTTRQEGIRVDANSGGVRIGLYGVTAVARQTLSAAATDAATTMALVNEIRAALIALGACQ